MKAQNNGAAKYLTLQPIELKGKVDKPTIIIGDFNFSFSRIEKKITRQKISKGID